MDISKEELLEERLIVLEETCNMQSKTLGDLLEYLSRIDLNFKIDLKDYDWRHRLGKMRQHEREEKEICNAKRILGNHGYLVVANERELDAARVKQWVNTKPDPDDIPF